MSTLRDDLNRRKESERAVDDQRRRMVDIMKGLEDQLKSITTELHGMRGACSANIYCMLPASSPPSPAPLSSSPHRGLNICASAALLCAAIRGAAAEAGHGGARAHAAGRDLDTAGRQDGMPHKTCVFQNLFGLATRVSYRTILCPTEAVTMGLLGRAVGHSTNQWGQGELTLFVGGRRRTAA